MNISQIGIARICHEANKAYCEACNDTSQKGWDEAEDWQRDSAVKGVDFTINNPTAGVSAQHDSWMAEKLAQGWSLGDVKDPEKKTHPCLVPYDKLPKFQRRKDALFQSIVRALTN